MSDSDCTVPADFMIIIIVPTGSANGNYAAMYNVYPCLYGWYVQLVYMYVTLAVYYIYSRLKLKVLVVGVDKYLVVSGPEYHIASIWLLTLTDGSCWKVCLVCLETSHAKQDWKQLRLQAILNVNALCPTRM